MFKGSIVALVTPFSSDQIDLEKLRELVELHIDAGTHAIVAAGTTGEAGTLSFEEKLLVIKTIVDQAKERIPIIAGTAANATKECIELTLAAMECGVHAALIMTPYYIKPTQDGLYQHYQNIAAAVGLPIILYNVPSRTGCDLLPDTAARLGQISNIIGIKEAVNSMTRLQELIRSCEDNLEIYSGDDPTCAQWLLAGAKGVISVTANVTPRLMAKLCDAAHDQDNISCLRINEQIKSLHESLFVESNPIPVKWCLYKMGLINDELRLPMTSLSNKCKGSVENILNELNLIAVRKSNNA